MLFAGDGGEIIGQLGERRGSQRGHRALRSSTAHLVRARQVAVRETLREGLHQVTRGAEEIGQREIQGERQRDDQPGEPDDHAAQHAQSLEHHRAEEHAQHAAGGGTGGEIRQGEDIHQEQRPAQQAGRGKLRQAVRIAEEHPKTHQEEARRDEERAVSRQLLEEEDERRGDLASIGRDQAEEGQQSAERDHRPDDIQLAVGGDGLHLRLEVEDLDRLRAGLARRGFTARGTRGGTVRGGVLEDARAFFGLAAGERWCGLFLVWHETCFPQNAVK